MGPKDSAALILVSLSQTPAYRLQLSFVLQTLRSAQVGTRIARRRRTRTYGDMPCTSVQRMQRPLSNDKSQALRGRIRFHCVVDSSNTLCSRILPFLSFTVTQGCICHGGWLVPPITNGRPSHRKSEKQIVNEPYQDPSHLTIQQPTINIGWLCSYVVQSCVLWLLTA